MTDLSDEKKIEEAFKILIKHIDGSGNNPKPVMFHSIRVGISLYNYRYDKDIVIAGILHDLFEDSSATNTEIEEVFGKTVTGLVLALTFDKSISNKRQRFLENLERIMDDGEPALIVKTADFLDNSNYYSLSESEEQFELMLFKVSTFLENSKHIIGDEPIWQDLDRKVKKIKNHGSISG